MRISVISFTGQGHALSLKIKELFPEWEAELFYKPEQGLLEWAKEQFAARRAMVFIGACGIAVRTVAPCVKDKLSEPPVVVLDEAGRFVIPILSGHAGGANELANALAERLEATAVITTATDIRGKFAVDLFAKKNDLRILNKEGVAKISAKILRGERVTLAVCGGFESECEIEGTAPPEVERISIAGEENVDILISPEAEDERWLDRAVLRLKPKEYVLGVGCKRGKSAETLEEFVRVNLERRGMNISDTCVISSVKQKRDEEGICALAERLGVPFLTFSAEELQAVEGDFESSDFVERTVGVGNVCERAAMAACFGRGEPVFGKQTGDGMTLAAARRRQTLKWEWKQTYGI